MINDKKSVKFLKFADRNSSDFSVAYMTLPDVFLWVDKVWVCIFAIDFCYFLKVFLGFMNMFVKLLRAGCVLKYCGFNLEISFEFESFVSWTV